MAASICSSVSILSRESTPCARGGAGAIVCGDALALLEEAAGALSRLRALLCHAALLVTPGPVRMDLCETSRELKVEEKSRQSIQKMPSGAFLKSRSSAMLACRPHSSESSLQSPVHSASEPHGFLSLIILMPPTWMLVRTE